VADRVVLMNQGAVEQVGTPQTVWDHPASPFVYGFLGDVNLFHGRAHEGQMLLGGHLDGVSIASPEHAAAQDAQALAYVRPHDIEVQRHVPGQPGQSGIVARLERAIVVGPVARLELLPADGPAHAGTGHDPLIEAQLSAERFRELGLKEGDTVLLSARKARVFLQPETV